MWQQIRNTFCYTTVPERIETEAVGRQLVIGTERAGASSCGEHGVWRSVGSRCLLFWHMHLYVRPFTHWKEPHSYALCKGLFHACFPVFREETLQRKVRKGIIITCVRQPDLCFKLCSTRSQPSHIRTGDNPAKALKPGLGTERMTPKFA
jgi:hypothetical protein